MPGPEERKARDKINRVFAASRTAPTIGVIPVQDEIDPTTGKPFIDPRFRPLAEFQFTKETTPLSNQLIGQLPTPFSSGLETAFGGTAGSTATRADKITPQTLPELSIGGFQITEETPIEIPDPFVGAVKGFATAGARAKSIVTGQSSEEFFQDLPRILKEPPASTGEALGRIIPAIATLGLSEKPLTLEEQGHPLVVLTTAVPTGAIAVPFLRPGFFILNRTVTSKVLPAISQQALAAERGGGVLGSFIPKARYVDTDPVMQAIVVPQTSIPRANVFGLAPISPGLTRGELLTNFMRNTVGRAFNLANDEAVGTAAVRFRAEKLEGAVANNAAVFSSQHGVSLRNAFPVNARGQIEALAGIDSTLPGAPTIQDIAARLPRFWGKLSPDQQRALIALRSDMRPYLDDMVDMGLDPGTRPDVIEGGFYLPRGNAAKEGADIAVSRVKGRGRFAGGKSGSEKTAKFDSMAQGIDEGWEYAAITDVLHGYSSDTGTRLVNKHVANYFLAIEDATGMKIGLTPTARLSAAERGIMAQVKALKNKIRARNQTLTAQSVRLAAVGSEAKRTGRAVEAAGARVESATERAAMAAAVTQDDLVASRRVFDQVVRDARMVAVEITKTHQRIIQMGGRVTTAQRNAAAAADKALIAFAQAERLEGELALRVITGKTRNQTIIKAVNRQQQTVNRALAYMEKSQKPYDDLAGQLDALIEKDMGLRGFSADLRLEQTIARQTERANVRQLISFSAAKREMNVLIREHKRQVRTLERVGQRESNVTQRVNATGEAIEDFQEELDGLSAAYTAAVAESRQTPRGMATIDLMGLNNHAFPVEIADAANKVLNPKDRAVAYLAVKNMMQALNATADMSATAIQGLLGLVDNPKGFGRALWTSLRAWEVGGDKMLGNFIQMYDARAVQRGLLRAQDWGRKGLRIGGQDIGEFQLGRGPTAAIGKLPVVRQANRAFGFFGDALRLEWAESMLMDEIAIGRTIQEIEAAGDLTRIIDATNAMTGWSRTRAFGNLGDALLFAPRFLQARLDTLAKAGMGVAREPLPGVRTVGGGAKLDQRLAQRALLKTVGTAVILTETFNRMQGRETDWDLFTKDSQGKRILNSNFMTVRGFGRDWKLLGTWDSIARALILVGMGRPQDAYRNMSAPPVSLAWDLIAGSNVIGERTRDSEVQAAQTIFKSMLPFAADELPEIGKKAREGQVAPAAATLIGEIIGGKSAPLGYVDVTRDVAAELFPDEAFEDLDRGQLRQVSENPRVADQIAKIEKRATPTTERQRLNQAFDDLAVKHTEQEKEFRTNLDAGMTGGALREQISEFKQTRFITSNAIMDQPDLVEIMARDNDQATKDMLAEAYWTASAPEDPQSGIPDFTERDRKRDAVLEVARTSGVPQDYITGSGEGTYRGQRFDDPVVRTVIEEYDADMATLRPYYDTITQLVEQFGIEEMWDTYLRSPQKQSFLDQPENRILKVALKVSGAQRDAIRRSTPEIERLLWKWGLVERLLNPTVAGEVTLLKIRQGGAITDTRAISDLAPAAAP